MSEERTNRIKYEKESTGAIVVWRDGVSVPLAELADKGGSGDADHSSEGGGDLRVVA